MKMACKICEQIEKKEGKIVYEDDDAVVIIPDEMCAVGHLQVIPKKHVETMDDLKDDIALKFFYIASFSATAIFEGLGMQGTNIMINNGAGSSRKHEHLIIDVVPRAENDGIDLQWKPKQMNPQDMESVMNKIKDKADLIGHKRESTEPVDVSSADVEKMGDEEENYLVSGLYRIP